ncbi:MAG: efflux RND transporter permease subunit [Lewinellaceae bacterium]|nr:efflux RND transporter permease subunit [Lewinellaceae bacterium]MCB9287389.1 efflux RND transporter permease subunit [Lewinellaceae bacterium]
MNIPQLSIKNYQFTLTAFAFLLVMGIASFFSMPRREDPALDIPNVLVIAVYPGANPEDVESQVVDILEESVNELDDLKEVQTTIRDGVAIMEIEFNFGVDPDEKFDEVQRQVNQSRNEMPEGLYQLDVKKMSTNTVTIMQIGLVSDTADYGLLQSEAERLKREIEKVGGVRKVDVEAYPEQEVRIALNPVLMSEMGISPDDVERAIQSNNANIPGGAVKVSHKLFNVKTSGQYTSLDQIRNTVVGAYQGRIIYLKNIASVFFDFEDERWLARYNGERTVFINVQQKDGYNIYSVTDPIKEKLSRANLAGDIRLAYIFDQSEGVTERVAGFLGNLVQGILLVGVIIFLVLGLRSASLVMLAIPFSILIGLWVVDQFGFALQQMSIAGLVVALGLLVDNSIAILENIERYLTQGYSREQAAIEGTQQLIAPIASATLTTILAFIPIVMMPDTTGAFIKALPTTVIATLAASFIVAVTLTPYLASRILKEGNNGTTRKTTPLFRMLKRFVEGPYRRALEWALRHKPLTISMAVLSLVGALALFPLVGVAFFPKAEKPQFRITVQLPNGSNLDATDEAVQYVESVIDTIPDIRYYAANIGHGNPRIYYNVASENYSNTFGEVYVVLKEYDIDRFYELLGQLREAFAAYPNARIDVREFVQGPPSEAPVAIKINGTDLDKLQAYAREVENIVRSVDGTVNVDNPIRNNSTDIYFRVNRDKAMMLGVPTHVVDKTIRSFVNGTVIGKFRDKDAEDYNIAMRFDYDEQFRLDDFSRISVQSVSGRFIPLKHLTDVEFAEAPSRITHLDSERTATVLADLQKGFTLDEVVADIDRQLQQMDWEDGYSYVYKGDLESRNESFGGMGIASMMALLLILGVLIIQFKSFSQPLIIFTALPLAIIGSILALLATGINFSFTAFVGLTSLIGIAINNSIVLVDFANVMRREGAGVLEAAQQAGEVRFIPIVMTTLTTILGLLPLTLMGGSLWAPMGWTIIGGLLTSTTFVLLLVPILYVLFTKEDTGAIKA